MRLEYEVTKNDKAQFAKTIIRLQNKLGLNVLFIFILSLAIAWSLHALHGHHSQATYRIFTTWHTINVEIIRDIIVFVASVIAISTVIILNIKQQYQQLLNCKVKHLTVCCNEDGVDIQRDNTYRYRSWQGTRALINMNSAIYLYNSDHQIPASNDDDCIIIPKQIFTTQQAFFHFTSFVEQHAASSQHIA